MRKLLIVLGLSSMMLLTGCDNNEKNTKISVVNRYVNTTDTIKVNTYNGYELIKSKTKNNKDGSIDILLEIDKPIR